MNAFEDSLRSTSIVLIRLASIKQRKAGLLLANGLSLQCVLPKRNVENQ